MIVFGESTAVLGVVEGAKKLHDTTTIDIAITLAMAIIPFFIFQSFKCDYLLLISVKALSNLVKGIYIYDWGDFYITLHIWK